MLKYYATSLPSTRRLAFLKQVFCHSFDGNVHFLRFKIKITFLGKFGPKNHNCMFTIMVVHTEINLNVLNSMAMPIYIEIHFYQKYTFWANFLQNIKIAYILSWCVTFVKRNGWKTVWFKDTISPYYCLLKKPIFHSKKSMTKWHHISLNSQFTVAFNGIICFSLRFCDNSLLMLKVRFQAFSFASKKVQGFSKGFISKRKKWTLPSNEWKTTCFKKAKRLVDGRLVA